MGDLNHTQHYFGFIRKASWKSTEQDEFPPLRLKKWSWEAHGFKNSLGKP
jgi:hypothetical protein